MNEPAPNSHASYRPLADPVFVVALFAFAANRWCFEPLAAGHTEFMHSYVNDLLCIPFWMPILVGCASRLRLRPRGLRPTPPEIAVVLPLWGLLFEGVGPRLPASLANTVADPWDLVAYAVGALAAMAIWESRARAPHPSPGALDDYFMNSLPRAKILHEPAPSHAKRRPGARAPSPASNGEP